MQLLRDCGTICLLPFAMLSHKSHCLKRKCSSTLAAETQITCESLAEVEWIRGLFEELTNPKFSIVEWAARSRNRGLLIAARSSDAEVRLPKVLSIGDAKRLYDHLRTETIGWRQRQAYSNRHSDHQGQHGRTRCNGTVGGPQWHVCSGNDEEKR